MSNTMRAVVVDPDPAAPPVRVAEDWALPEPGPGEVRVRLRRAGLNRRDAMNVAGRARFPSPAIIGSDGTGVVDLLGDGVTGWSHGDEVVLSPSIDWGDDVRVQAAGYEILGDERPGTQAQYVVVPAGNLFAKPPSLSWDEAAALPMAGLTAWRAVVTRGEVRAGQRVLVTGASGGVATFAVQIAVALGARVFVTTSSRDKLRRAVDIGAEAGVVRGEDRLEELASAVGGFHTVIDSAGADWPALVESLLPGGVLVNVGRTAAEIGEVPVRLLFWRQLDVRGSSMGSGEEFGALLGHMGSVSWRPAIDRVFPLADAAAAYRRLDEAHFGNILLDVT